MMGLRVFIGGETSGRVREAFRNLGHDAWSCDLLPSEDGSEHHITGDLRNHIADGWDIGIFHPPCTRLCNSGVRWLNSPPRDRTLDEMWADLDEGARLFSDCWNAPISMVAVENPVMHKYAKERIVNYRPPAQIIQPWWFGDRAFKATGLYLRGLPPLHATDQLKPPATGTEEHKRWSIVHRMPPGPERWKERSRTYQGLADAMASQWGNYATRRAA